jgi:hypothetical protein
MHSQPTDIDGRRERFIASARNRTRDMREYYLELVLEEPDLIAKVTSQTTAKFVGKQYI